ncbi:MAG TPA: class I SAM-dependent methyltransferase [Streptosporangiaceae bacterium]|nr:class I SAM-dependent methyltransferase [Streptosporangiaceae bacterium]
MADPDDRGKRHRQRKLFDSVAELYDSTRSGYPGEIVAAMVATSGVRAGSRVLEVGCGTGQLTRDLATYGFELTAIDLGAAMVGAARRHVPGQAVAFQVSSYEDFEAPDHTFDLVASATAFHWIDPEVAWAKAVRLLVPGGWLAVLSTGEHYDDPLGAALMDIWVRHGDDGGAWTRAAPPTVAESMSRTGLFGTPVVRLHTERRSIPAERVLGLEQTRATSLSYDTQTRESFRDELAALLGSSVDVGMAQETSLTMGQSVA